MAAQEADMMMTVSQLERQVGNGTYIFRRPLTIVQCAVQEKYIVYPSCQQCNKRVSPENNGFVCPIHRWQRGVVYQFAMRILLQDAIGSEVWATLFNAKAVQVLGFTANDYMNMKSDAERYAALDMLRGAQVMVTIRKREAGQYVNYTEELRRGLHVQSCFTTTTHAKYGGREDTNASTNYTVRIPDENRRPEARRGVREHRRPTYHHSPEAVDVDHHSPEAVDVDHRGRRH